ncbi:copper amine oxidase N-terminal domain-containing protein [Paenibacillus sp. FSL R7-0337]|uniref:copper amine oxidase N-terminal domain-containing protein n=1 Tax=Paenibacillus sp. FSL R7-0337 TaxID=1926588 RepID=UPI000970037D|nr:copper amine oxidase N-terminal domain-containing protein [Paenibacillus sp. FSL R7-0337]OMF88760.1 hypothetical protein BK147_26510 [Paenibacillus sp. FSL R7-0337]
MKNTSDCLSGKGQAINCNTEIHMSAIYSRDKPVKRKFNFVIHGLLISSFLLSSIISYEGNTASAATSHPTIEPTIQPVTASQGVYMNSQDEEALISNLSFANKVIRESGFSANALLSLMNRLKEIDARASTSQGFISVRTLQSVLSETEQLIITYDSDVPLNRGNVQTVKDKLASIKQKIRTENSSNYALQSSVSKKNELKSLSVANLTPSIVIDGVKQSYSQSPISKSGSILVPLRGVFESLGVNVLWSRETETITANKGSTKVTLKMGSNIAYVNGSEVKLSASLAKINGCSMVPLRFVSEAFGGTVKWDNDTQTANIITGSSHNVVIDSTKTQKVNGITVKYGKHTYGVRDQSEYDESMKIVLEALKGVDNVIFGGDLYSPYYYQFIDGARWSEDTRDRSDQNRGLKSAENSIGDFVKAGVSSDEIIKAYKIMIVAGELIKGKKDPMDGSPSSIFDTLIRGISDCDSDAETYSATFDLMGYNTMIIGGSGHAEVLIQINGFWYETAAGSFKLVDVAKALENSSVIVSEPTFGKL